MKWKKSMMLLLAVVFSSLTYMSAQDTLSVKEVVVKHANNADLSNGEIHISIENGVPPFEYTLSTTEQIRTTERFVVFQNLKSFGKYWIVVEDNNSNVVFENNIKVSSNEKK
jgi:hypothetical protein